MTPRSANGPSLVVGIFVGGRGRRLGGVNKGQLLTDSGETILTRLLGVLEMAVPRAEVVLIGDDTAAAPHLTRLADDPPQRGPLGGLSALLRYAGASRAVALASDLPTVSAALIERLVLEAPEADLFAPRLDGIFQPFFARYEPLRMTPLVDRVLATSRASLLAVFELAHSTEMVLDDAERAALRDWDQPADLPPGLRAQLAAAPIDDRSSGDGSDGLDGG